MGTFTPRRVQNSPLTAKVPHGHSDRKGQTDSGDRVSVGQSCSEDLDGEPENSILWRRCGLSKDSCVIGLLSVNQHRKLNEMCCRG
ncbi:MAG: hypothetical protein AAFW75_19030 [Cyanobacteria bacterium J06636_16]